MTKNNAVVAIYKSHAEAETAVKELQQSGFDMKKLSIVGRDYHTDEHVVGYYNTGDRMKHWGKLGAFWGGIWGLLFGSAFFLIPGVGPLLIAGPLVGWIVGALEGAVVVGGLSALGAGLLQPGHPQGQHSAIRDGHQIRQVCRDRPRLRHGNNSRPRDHQPHQPGGVGSTSAFTHQSRTAARGSIVWVQDIEKRRAEDCAPYSQVRFMAGEQVPKGARNNYL